MGATLANPSTVYNASEGDKFNADTTLVVVCCPTCHVRYAIPESLRTSAKRWSGGGPRSWSICCPLGHTWHYGGRTIEEKLEAERDRRAATEAALDQARASARAEKAAKTRIKNSRDRERQKAHGGVCPVSGCRRHFENLERHMVSKHPDFDGALDA